MNRRASNSILCSLVLLTIFFLTACAKIHLNTIPPPPPTAKLRVYVQPFTGYGTWAASHEEFVDGSVRTVERYLKETGIYEVVSKEDVRAVLGDQNPARWQMSSYEWALARKIGRALHAEYVMIVERNLGDIGGGYDFTVDNVLINIETGKRYSSSYRLNRATRYDRDRIRDLIRATYRNIFRNAKGDLLTTAITKSERTALPQETAAVAPLPAPPPQTSAPTAQEPKPAPAPVQKKVEQPEPVKKTEQSMSTPERLPAAQKPGEGDRTREANAENALTQASASAKGAKLVVYDLEALGNYQPVALILTDALREELYRLKQFVLVNRENLQQVLQEMALQQTGLIDEKQAVKTGKVLAANQVVTGRLGLLGKTYVLQAKRIDVESLATLGLTSARFKEGQEEEILSKMPDLAKSLSGLK